MTRRISLALALHNHQPVGNFGWVIAESYDRAYLPLLEALERHPTIHLALHYSGPLLEWLQAERPEFIARLRALSERGQVDILGGGLYEPVLAALPDRDRLGQLERMADVVESVFRRRATGAWLAERVWQPDLPTSIVDAGYRWTILDDAHLRAAAIPEDEMWGPYATEDQGRLLTVFGTEQMLRYLIPFRPVEEVIAYLREQATERGERVGMMGDDGEKFGTWPSTWEYCWGEGRWVESFFEALEANAAWLSTTTPSAWLAAHAPVGRAYFPTGSYSEMGEWALPAEESVAYTSAVRHARETGAPEARWLRGGFWRNFQVKYREVNDLHKQMLRVSEKVAALPPGFVRDAALDHLYRGQSNDCYWHGLFGGIYIAHMRAATLGHIIAAEDLADRAMGRERVAEVRDLDLDGRDEVLLANEGQVVALELDEGAGIGSWDLRSARHAVTGVMRRRPEAYHEALRAHEREAMKAEVATTAATSAATPAATSAPTAADGNGAAATSIHDAVRVKELGLSERLVYDDYERRSGLVRFLPEDWTASDWAAGGRGDLADFVDGPFVLDRVDAEGAGMHRDGVVIVGDQPHELRVTKTLRLRGGRLDPRLELEVSVENRSNRELRARLGIEWAITMLGGGGNPQAWWEVDGGRLRHDIAGTTSAASIVQGNDWLGVSLETRVDREGDLWWAPIETVSNSEDGFERVYQGSALLISWPVAIQPGASWATRMEHVVTIDGDRAEGESAPENPSARGLRAAG